MKRVTLTTIIVLISVASRVDASVHYSETVLSQNPIAYYRLNETSGATALTSSAETTRHTVQR